MRIGYFGISDQGAARSLNQDSIFMYGNDRSGFALFVVADGMGGHFEGETASRLITNNLKGWAENFNPNVHDYRFSEIMNALVHELECVNEQIYRTYSTQSVCGSTCSVLLIVQDSYGIIQVGDSRIYQIRRRKLHQLTTDDVWENQQSVRESYSDSAIAAHPNRGKLLKAVGTQNRLVPTVRTDSWKKKDSFLLCSDGLYKYCPEKFIEKTIKGMTEANMKEKTGRLMARVYENGAGDNVSVILVRCS